jgi:hypothetical protein
MIDTKDGTPEENKAAPPVPASAASSAPKWPATVLGVGWAVANCQGDGGSL